VISIIISLLCEIPVEAAREQKGCGLVLFQIDKMGAVLAETSAQLRQLRLIKKAGLAVDLF
jgi:hypothetical protein